MYGSLIIIIWQYDDHHLEFTNPKTIQISGHVMFTIIPQYNDHHFKFADCHSESFFFNLLSYEKISFIQPIKSCLPAKTQQTVLKIS